MSHFPAYRRLAVALAEAMVAGPWREEDLVERGAHAIGRRWRALRPLARRVLGAFEGFRPPAARLAEFLLLDAGFRRACKNRPESKARLSVRRVPAPEPAMWPALGTARSWAVPRITTPGELATFLGLTPTELDWFADVQGRTPRSPAGALRHYRYEWRPRASGSPRLIEMPKARLKVIQRRLLDFILVAIPPHEAAHGFQPGRSVKTFAEPHAGQRVVLVMDLRDFFPSVTAARVLAIFLTAGYPEPVARLIAGLCTSRVPSEVWGAPGAPGEGPDTWRAARLFRQPHLPQGAPTSPALANLCAYRLDTRLTALAGVAGACYTRYADDLAFSGDSGLERSLRRFIVQVGAVAIEEGFEVQPRKTRVMRRGVRQQVAGVVVNDRPNVARDVYERLEAILYNCIKTGPVAQNRDDHADFRAHLTGRVAHIAMLNPARGRKLTEMLGRITW
jgi:hypothetical protein